MVQDSRMKLARMGPQVGYCLNGCRVSGEDDDVLGEVAVEVILDEADRQYECAKICVKCGGSDAEVHVVFTLCGLFRCLGRRLLLCGGRVASLSWLALEPQENTVRWSGVLVLVWNTLPISSARHRV